VCLFTSKSLEGALIYPNETGGWQIGNTDLSEYLDQYRDQKVVVIVAPLGKAKRKPRVCGICGFVLNEAGECPRCKLVVAAIIQHLRERKEEREQLFDDIQRFLDGQ